MGRTNQSGWTGSFVAPPPKVDFLTPGRVGDGIENGHAIVFLYWTSWWKILFQFSLVSPTGFRPVSLA